MRPGLHQFYVIKYRRTHASPHLKPDGKLSPVKKKDNCWRTVGDYFVWTLPERLKDAWHDHWQQTFISGWADVQQALKVLNVLRKRDKEGAFNPTHSGKDICAVRHEFKLVFVVTSLTEIAVDKKTGAPVLAEKEHSDD